MLLELYGSITPLRRAQLGLQLEERHTVSKPRRAFAFFLERGILAMEVEERAD